MDTLIKVLECWVPNRDRTCLEFSGGLIGEATQFAEAGRSTLCGQAQELPAKAWRAGQPVLLPQLHTSEHRRTDAADVTELGGGVAVPIYAGDFLTAVFVILCASDAGCSGAIELWRMTPSSWPDILLVDGFYGTATRALEQASRRTAFRKGTGLPGRVWETGSPILIDDADNPENFVRAEPAALSGIKRALGLPCNAGRHNVCVLTLLSDPRTPLARRTEIWAPNGTHRRLMRIDGYCVRDGRLGQNGATTYLERSHGVIGRAADTGIPAFSARAVDDAAPLADERAAAQLTSVAAMPMIRDGTLYGVTALYF